MPAQTTVKGNVYIPDGALVSLKGAGESSYTDVGIIMSAVNLAINWDETTTEAANGKLDQYIRNMTVTGGFTLGNLNPDSIARMGGGLFTKVETTGDAISAFTNQSIVGFVAGVTSDLIPVVTATGKVMKFSADPVITSITGSSSGALAAGDDYLVVKNNMSPSGYSVLFNPSGTATPATNETYTVVFGTNTPLASTTLYCGSSTATLSAYAMKITHTDDNGKIREAELFSVTSNTGGFQFNFKGANEDGIEEMPLAFTGRIDTSRTNGRQLMSWHVDTGAM